MKSDKIRRAVGWIVTITILLFTAESLIAASDFRVLVFSKTLLYRHASITNGVAMLKKLGSENNFAVDATEDATAFTSANLAQYKIILFLSTSGDVLNDAQQNAFRDFVESGGGFVGIHAAVAGKVATEGDWPWYSQTFCTEFDNHKAIERATVLVEDKCHISSVNLPERWSASTSGTTSPPVPEQKSMSSPRSTKPHFTAEQWVITTP